jgi:glycosyltransferase involved in cell wall biosynthesis
MTISYAIPVCNEHTELHRLLSVLFQYKRPADEIVVQADLGNTTAEVYEVLDEFKSSIKLVEFPLNGDFASFKNNLKSNCKGDWIFQIDADEYLKPELIANLDLILQQNQEIDIYLLPRINTVSGLTLSHIDKWKWNVNAKGWVNFPDLQTRILRNIDSIKWINKVHEVLSGYKSFTTFPLEEDYCLIHEKNIERQEKQNKLYSML